MIGSSVLGTYGFNKEQKNDNFKQLLKLDKKNNNVFIFSNVYWIIGMNDTANLFDDVIDL